jgi:hypothetical protein
MPLTKDWVSHHPDTRSLGLTRDVAGDRDNVMRTSRRGFAGERHMDRVFRRLVGATPAAWPKAIRH